MNSYRTAVYLQVLASAAAAALADCTSRPIKWNYETGVLLSALGELSRRRFAGLFDAPMQSCVDELVLEDGTIRGYSVDEFNLDQINPGKELFSLWKATGRKAYEKAIRTLAGQLAHQPRTASGSYWHKKIYPDQVWLDGLYMFGPFQARYGIEFGQPELIDDVCRQFLAVQVSMKHAASGLYYHAKDEKGVSKWADPQTGCSPHVWARGVGWLSMALVDTLDWIPPEHGQRAQIMGMLAELLDAVVRAQQESGLWLQVADVPSGSGNYGETSASAMFAYALYKSVRAGYSRNETQAGQWLRAASSALEGILTFIRWECPEGAIPRLHLGGICKVAGLGGNPYRDGSFEYYIHEPVVSDDFKGTGPFMLALSEAIHFSRR
ncbi:MAG: glycoside hydrolase family 88 protein [Rectinema sp.]